MVKKIIFILIIACLGLRSQVLINEFQPAPDGDESEWIELHNYSISTIELSSPRIGDNRTFKSFSALSIPAGGFVIITKDTNELKNQYYIPPTTIMVELTIPTLNNTTDEVRLYDGDTKLDSVYYDMKNGIKGHSFERVSGKVSSQFLPCQSPKKGTPGMRNSVYIPNCDFRFLSYNFDHEKIEIEIEKRGICEVETVRLLVKYEGFKDYIIAEGTKFYYDLTKINNEIENFEYRKIRFIIDDANDEVKINDTLFVDYYKSPPRNLLRFNEIMFNSLPEYGNFVELYNGTGKDVHLRGWQLVEEASYNSGKGSIINEDIILRPSQYQVIAWDSSYYNYGAEGTIASPRVVINTSGDMLMLISPTGIVADSMYYLQNWLPSSVRSAKGLSIEKANPLSESSDQNNWFVSGDPSGSTPSKQNSNYVFALEGDVDINTNPFGNDKPCLIAYNLPFERAYITASITDRAGNVLRSLSENRLSSKSGSFVWSGNDDYNALLPAGPYILLIEALDADSQQTFAKRVVIIKAQ